MKPLEGQDSRIIARPDGWDCIILKNINFAMCLYIKIDQYRNLVYYGSALCDVLRGWYLLNLYQYVWYKKQYTALKLKVKRKKRIIYY